MSVSDIGTTFETKSIIVIAAVTLITTAGVGGAALGVGPLGVQETAVAQQESPLETAVSLEPSNATVTNGETTTYDVVVDTANGGVGAYDFSVSIADSNVASISDVSVGGEPAEATTDVSIAEDGSSADVAAALANTSDSGSVTIATITVQGDEAETSDVGLTVEALGTEAGESYVVTETTGASITVEADDPPPAASFQVSNLSAPDTAQLPDPSNAEGIQIEISADITNVGGQTGTQTVELRVDNQADGALESDEWISQQEVTLDPGETRTVRFTDIDTRDMASPFGVFSANDSATGQITLEDPDEDEPEPTPAPETPVSIEPESATVDEGEEATYEVVVPNADGGVGAYNVTVSVDNPDVASITDAAAEGNPSEETTTVSIADDGSSADVVAALADTDDTGNVTIATVTVSGDNDGTSDIGLSVDALGTEAGDSYSVSDVSGATITVEAADEDDDDDDSPEPEPEPANFQVSNLNAPDSATQGDAIDVSADVTNDGDQEATQTVEFRLDIDGDGTLNDDEALTSQGVTLDGDETQTVTFEDLDTSGLDAGDYTHGVVTDDDSTTATITIEAADEDDDDDDSPEPEPEPANFQVSNLNAPDSATQGDAIDVSADVTNDGDEEDTQTVEFRLDVDGDGTLGGDEALSSQEVTLDGDETQTVMFEGIDTSGLDPGDYTHGVVTDDDSATATITIDEEQDDEETIYWQVDFGEGDSPPMPPSYHPNDLMAALGNSDDGVTQNPSLRRQESDGQLGDVTIVDEKFKFDDEGNPTKVTVEFEIDEDGEARDLHLAVFVLPGPFDVDEIDQQELYEVTNATYEGGDTGELTVSIPQGDDE